jgi:hypothetical protein
MPDKEELLARREFLRKSGGFSVIAASVLALGATSLFGGCEGGYEDYTPWSNGSWTNSWFSYSDYPDAT